MATFPTSLPNRTGTPLGLMTVANVKPGKLSAALAAGATTVQVDFDPVAAGYPTSGYLPISRAGVPREVVKYSGRSSTGGNPGSFTGLTRGLDGSTDQAHLAGDDIDMALVAGVVNGLSDELIAGLTKLGTGSSTPATAGHVLAVTGAGSTAYGYISPTSVIGRYCVAVASASQSLVSSTTWYPIALGAEVSDAYAMHDTSTNNSRIVFGAAGRYLIVGSFTWDFGTNSGSDRLVAALFVNGTSGSMIANQDMYVNLSPDVASVQLVGIYDASSTDYVEMYGMWLSNGPHSTYYASGNPTIARLTVTQLPS